MFVVTVLSWALAASKLHFLFCRILLACEATIPKQGLTFVNWGASESYGRTVVSQKTMNLVSPGNDT